MKKHSRSLTWKLLLLAAFLVSACDTEPGAPSATDKALDELQRQYDELIRDRTNDPVEWAADDLENIGDWEYRVENIEFSSADDLADQLNALGNDRWEVIWLDKTADGFMVVLKKPSISYLSKIPLSQLGKLVIPAPEGGE